MGWLTEQWQQMRGNIKWDLLKLAGASVITAAYLFLQKLRHLSLDWLVAVGLFVVSLVAFLYLGRARRNVGQSSSTQNSATALTVGARPFDATEFFRRSYYSPLQSEIETNVRTAAIHNQPNDRDGFYVKLLAVGLISYNYDMIWSNIFKSQLLALLELNRQNGLLPLAAFKTYYDQAALSDPTPYAHYSFDQWLAFMQSQLLIIRHPSDMVEITHRGKDFLKYLLHWGRESDQRRL